MFAGWTAGCELCGSCYLCSISAEPRGGSEVSTSDFWGAGKIQGLPWEEILSPGAVAALPCLNSSKDTGRGGGGLFLPTEPPGREAATEPSSSAFWIMLKLLDKQEWSCRMITLFGKNRAALALQRKGSVNLTREWAQGCFPVEECVFGEPCPTPGAQEAAGIWSIPICSISCWLMQCPDLMYLPNPWAACPVLGFLCLPFPHCLVEFCVGLGNPWERLCPYLLLGVSQLCFLSLLGTEVRSPWAEEGLSCDPVTAGISLQFHESDLHSREVL